MFDSRRPRTPAALVPKEQLGAWRRWQTAALEIPREPEVAEPAAEPEPQVDPAAELEAAREQARAAGHAEGFKKGRAEGLAAGQKEGREKGQAEGRAEALKRGEAATRAEVAKLQSVLERCAEAVAQMETEVAQAVTQLALTVARQVLLTELRSHPEHVLATVQEVLRADLAEHGAVQLWLHPDDAALVSSHLGDTLAERNWRVAVDDTLERGGCRARSAYGDVDATLQTRWRQVCATLGVQAPWRTP